MRFHGNDGRSPGSLGMPSVNIYFFGERGPQFSIFLCWWLLSWLRWHLVEGQQLFEFRVSQRGSCRGAASTETFAFCHQCCSQKDPSLPRSSVTPSLCLSDDSGAACEAALTQLHPQFPASPDERGSVCSVCCLGEHTQGSTTCWLLSSPWLIFCSWSNFFSPACTSPLPTQELALTLPLMQLGLGLAETRRIIQFLSWQSVRVNRELGDSTLEQQCM